MLKNIWIFPVIVSVTVPASFILMYVIAVNNNHAQPMFPYISDTGSYPPESCIFGQLLNVASVFIGLVMYFRHRQIAEFHRHAKQSRRSFLRAGTVFLWVGYTSAFGMSMVGNFQQTNWLSAHMLGAFLAFAFGLVYCWAQTVFTYKMEPILHARWVSHVRMLLSVISTVSFILMASFGFNPFYESTHRKNFTATAGCNPNVWQLVFVQPGEKGYPGHLVTTFCEWIISFAFMIYFLTYAAELRHAALVPPKLVLIIERGKLPIDDGLIYESTKQQLDEYPDPDPDENPTAVNNVLPSPPSGKSATRSPSVMATHNHSELCRINKKSQPTRSSKRKMKQERTVNENGETI